jgi:ATP phosphoribosyltransferase
MLNNQPRLLKFAMPSVTSRLHEGSADILGISALSKDTPLVLQDAWFSLFQLRGTDIPAAVAKGWIDYGLCGLDAIVETQAQVSILREFPQTATKISLIERPRREDTPTADSYLVVTEYPVITRTHLEKRYSDLSIWKAHGACESFAFLDDVDGVVDIVDTGDTLSRNGLVVREVLFETCICLVGGYALDPVDPDEFLTETRRKVQSLKAFARARKGSQ